MEWQYNIERKLYLKLIVIKFSRNAVVLSIDSNAVVLEIRKGSKQSYDMYVMIVIKNLSLSVQIS